jgi:hypothetical protein
MKYMNFGVELGEPIKFNIETITAGDNLTAKITAP